VRTALKLGAEGIGLCRTEHMFFDEQRLVAMREMILASNAEGRRAALAKILPMQQQDFVELFELMVGHPVTIRLLDPPLHEFLPHDAVEIEAVADASGVDAAALQRRAHELREANPMQIPLQPLLKRPMKSLNQVSLKMKLKSRNYLTAHFLNYLMENQKNWESN